jgi:hypothetical protein
VNRTAADRADLTRKEQEHVRAAIRFLRVRIGTWETVAKALRFKRRRDREREHGAARGAARGRSDR